jgi:redox-sensitive bicupin YhaK (pirin superfamily)
MLDQVGRVGWLAGEFEITRRCVQALRKTRELTGKTVHLLQIFVNLARERRDIAPFALSLEAQDVPVVQSSGAKVRVPLGNYSGARSPLAPPTEVNMLDISLADGAELTAPVTAGHSAFVMPIFGTVAVDGRRFDRDELKLPVYPAQAMSHAIKLQAPEGDAKVMLFSGRPLR